MIRRPARRRAGALAAVVLLAFGCSNDGALSSSDADADPSTSTSAAPSTLPSGTEPPPSPSTSTTSTTTYPGGPTAPNGQRRPAPPISAAQTAQEIAFSERHLR